MRDVLNASPLKLVQRFADQNIAFWRNVLQGSVREDQAPEDRPDLLEAPPGTPVATQQSVTPEPPAGDDEDAERAGNGSGSGRDPGT